MKGFLPIGKIKCPACGKIIIDRSAIACPRCLKLLPQKLIRTKFF